MSQKYILVLIIALGFLGCNSSKSNQSVDSKNSIEENKTLNKKVIFFSPNAPYGTKKRHPKGTFDDPMLNSKWLCKDKPVLEGYTFYFRGGVYYNPDFNTTKSSSIPEIACSGTKKHPIVIKPWKNEHVKIKFDSSAGIKLSGDYLEFEGFEIEGMAQEIKFDDAIKHWWKSTPYYNGRGVVLNGVGLRLRDNVIHDTTGAGIGIGGGRGVDDLIIENNVIFNASWWNTAGTTAIGLVNFNKPKDAKKDGKAHIIIRDNLVFASESRIFSHVYSKGYSHLTLDEGSSMLIKNDNGSSYDLGFLIKNNFFLFNGKGISIRWDNTTFRNNTLYNNGTTIEGRGAGFRSNGGKGIILRDNAVATKLKVMEKDDVMNVVDFSKTAEVISCRDNLFEGGMSLLESQKCLSNNTITTDIFNNPDKLDFRTSTKAGASQATFEKLKKRVEDLGYHVAPANYTLNIDGVETPVKSQRYYEYQQERIKELVQDVEGFESISELGTFKTPKGKEIYGYEIRFSSKDNITGDKKFYLEVSKDSSSSKKNNSIEKDTYYKTKWFEPAKKAWNKAHPNNQFIYDWWEYEFPANADLVAGEPKDEPISPQDWMENAGLGMSMKIDIPSSNGVYNYSDELIKEWKAKGFRTGRFHIKPTDPNFQDLELDPTGATLKKSALADLKSTVERFVKNGMPLVISLDAHKEYVNVNENREEAFRLVVEWWREIAETLKDVSYTVAFENFVEFHGFDDQAIEFELEAKVENGENRYPNYTDSKGKKIDNYVRNLGYNNLMSELSRVIRVTNPKRIMLYKPLGIGRYDLANVTPWRWKSEGDPLGRVNQKSVYWLQSMGGSANLKTDYVLAFKENNETKKRQYLMATRKDTWGNAVDYYNQTHIPIWISLWGARLTKSAIDRDLGGVAPDDSIYVDYVNWYQKGIQTEAVKANGERVRVPSGFQQSWWIWDFKNSKWFNSPVGNFEDPIAVRNALIANRHGIGLKGKSFAPSFILSRITPAPAYVNREYNQTLATTCAYDRGEKPIFSKVSGADWLSVLADGTLSGVPSTEDKGVNSFTFSCHNRSGTAKTKIDIRVEDTPKVTIYPSDDATVQKNKADKNYGDSKFLIIRNSKSSVAREALLKFNVVDVNSTINRAILRLYSINYDGNITLKSISDTTFEESTLTWNSMPQIGESIATSRATGGSWVTFDLSNYIKSEGVYGLEIETLVDTTGKISSKEGSFSPELVLSLD